jgi:uncharacterized membrane protein YoaK (UPF0700 family)
MKYADSTPAAVAGYVATLSFVALFGLFTAHVTGNFVLTGAAAAGFGQGVVMKLMAFPAFSAGVVLSSVIVTATRSWGSSRGAVLLYGVQALLLGFCLAGVGVTPVVSASSVPAVACGMIRAAAMGVHNAHGRLIARAGVPNTVMTGKVTQSVLDALELVSSEVTAEVKSAARARLGKTLHAVACFGAGALAYRYVMFWALLMPFAVLVWLAAVDRDEPGLTDRAAGTKPR